MAEQTTGDPISAFLRGFRGSQDRIRAQQQQDIQNQLAEQLRGIQLMNAQQQAAEAPFRLAQLKEQLRLAQMTPQQKALENITTNYMQQEAAQPGFMFTGAAPVEEITPEAQGILNDRQYADQMNGLPFSRAGVPGITMQTAVPSIPGGVISPAKIARQQDQARLANAFKRELEGPQYKEVNGNLVKINSNGQIEIPLPAPVAAPKRTVQHVGNFLISFEDGKEVAREVVPQGNTVINTKNGSFIGNPDDPSSFKPIPGTESSATGAGKPPTEAQARAAKFSADVKQGNDALNRLFSKGFDPSTVNPLTSPFQAGANIATGVGEKFQNIPIVGGFIPNLPNVASRDIRQQYDQASEQIIEGALRFASGANTPPLEKKEYRKIYIDQIGDGPGVRAQKKAAREKLITGLQSLASGKIPQDILDSVVSFQEDSLVEQGGGLEITELPEE